MKQKMYLLLICLLMLGSFSYPTTKACENNQQTLNKKMITAANSQQSESASWMDFFPYNYIIIQ